MHEQPCTNDFDQLVQINYIPEHKSQEKIYYILGIALITAPIISAIGITNLQEALGTTTIGWYLFSKFIA